MTINIDSPLVQEAKMARRLTTNAFDSQVVMLLNAALIDMGIAGVEVPESLTPIVDQAAITYFLMHFGTPDNAEWLKASYDEQKAQLATCTGYTDWLGVEVG